MGKHLYLLLLLTTCAPLEHGGNVILLTLDGVRHQDVFDAAVMPHLNGARASTFLTDRMKVANRQLISLPAYESLMMGQLTDCPDNDCDRVTGETLPERAQRELYLAHGEVATFASWGRIQRAVASTKGSTLIDSGAEGAETDGEDSERMDDVTWERAVRHLKTKPRFLYISLNDPDFWAHANKRSEYLGALREDDARIAWLEAELKQMGDYGRNTTLIVTTDHGRGDGALWTEHYASLPESRDIWLYATGPQVDPEKLADATHLDIRPTIEKLIGLRPTRAALAAIAP